MQDVHVPERGRLILPRTQEAANWINGVSQQPVARRVNLGQSSLPHTPGLIWGLLGNSREV